MVLCCAQFEPPKRVTWASSGLQRTRSLPSVTLLCRDGRVFCTIDPKGQEVGFVAFTSVDVPECPELSFLKLTRVRMKCTMLVIPTADDPNATSEFFVMGSSESLSIANSQYRLNMTILNDISLVINSQNITRQTVVLHKDWVPNENRSSCTICSRKFHFISRRRHHCRMCGYVICKTCYVNRSAHQEETGNSRGVRSPAICQTKFCLRCVMGLRTADKQLKNFSPQVSKMLSINLDTLDMSATETFEEFLELDSPDSNPRASSFFFTFYKNTQDEIDTSRRTDVEFAWNTMADRVKPRAAVTSGGIGSLISYGSGKLMRTSIHSSSFTRLRGLSRLSRRSSTASIYSQPICPSKI